MVKRKTFKRVQSKTGFTLVELLVVIGIITLLLSILMPVLGKIKSLAMRIKCAHNLKQIHLALCLYSDDYDDTYLCAEDPVSTSPFYWLWMGRGWRPFLEPYLVTGINKDNPSVLLCPQDRSEPDKFESTSYAYSMAFYHSPEQIDAMSNIEDTWSNPQPSCPQKSCNVARPSGKIIIGEWASNHLRIEGDDPGWWGWRGSRNYLFADGQVRFLMADQIRPANDKLPDANLTIRGIKGIDWP